ncbi:site-specific integrase [Kitasatospora sp. NBC_00240]|uniref:tyrosine-type recombinase/integrase n=1 Tax=Kitasatospora sp. NBC_00240 TaxID=2903567 RepID=UPI0022591C23|nr:site-specific integrase [Kitasatospora sp. NBC_00240]MCX5215666.1 site-specific integrase [Kitasatospora sp. NBC_00240]
MTQTTTRAPLATRSTPTQTLRPYAGAEATDLLERFPPREPQLSWLATEASREDVLGRLQKPPLAGSTDSAQESRKRGARALLSWLESYPGGNWQARWAASPAASNPKTWHAEIVGWCRQHGIARVDRQCLDSGILALISADVIRPELSWLAARPSRFLGPAIAEARDPEGFARLERIIPPDIRGIPAASAGLTYLAQMIAVNGGGIDDIVVGDFLAMRQIRGAAQAKALRLAYYWLRDLDLLPADAPATLLLLENRTGQLTPAQLIDRYFLKSQPIRDLLVDYLTERSPGMDFNSLKHLSSLLAKVFWQDIERHHPGLDSLDLPPDVSAAWKTRVATKVVRTRQPDGSVIEEIHPRTSKTAVMMAVRTLYLDLVAWSLDEPARWGPWTAPCPVSEAETSGKKREQGQKTRSDQRTRERLPVLPTVVRVADRRLKEARTRLDAISAAPFGASFTVLGETFTAAKSTKRSAGTPSRSYDSLGGYRYFGTEEKHAFWAWAAIEILRHTGIRIEELLELSHHSIIRYKLPSTGEVVPLLQIAPSKTDQERLVLISPELADVLSAVVSRVRNENGVIPSIASYDMHERVWNAPMPLLFQWTNDSERRPISIATIRRALIRTLEASGITDASGKVLQFQPHDFRRIFITDAILNGLPPHIAQVIAGHRDINTTMGYNAVYPQAVLEAHRAFIARRRSVRPTEEYRAVSTEEWDEFLGHFARRKLSLGTCGRAYGSDCVHEHACIRCPVLIVDPFERGRLEEVRDNLVERITEAEREGWLQDVEGLSVSLDAAKEKIARLKEQEDRRSTTYLGIPTIRETD